jgi:hypothetical protein
MTGIVVRYTTRCHRPARRANARLRDRQTTAPALGLPNGCVSRCVLVAIWICPLAAMKRPHGRHRA